MFLKKYIVSIGILSTCCTLLLADDATATQEQRKIEIVDCKKIGFNLVLDQTNASKEEREVAIKIIKDFCDTHVIALSDTLSAQTPNVRIMVYLTDVEEDAIDDIAEEVEAEIVSSDAYADSSSESIASGDVY